MSKDDKNTFDFDETLPSLPLPELKDTMERYYTCIQPFGTKEELAQARSTIDEFQKGVGAELHDSACSSSIFFLARAMATMLATGAMLRAKRKLSIIRHSFLCMYVKVFWRVS